MNIPKEMQKTYEEISKLLIDYSTEYLSKEYEELCLHALEKLCRKRPYCSVWCCCVDGIVKGGDD